MTVPKKKNPKINFVSSFLLKWTVYVGKRTLLLRYVIFGVKEVFQKDNVLGIYLNI